MIRQIMLVALLVIWNGQAHAETLHSLPALEQPESRLQIYGAADYPAIAPLMAQFQKRNPRVSIDYTEFNTRVLYLRFLEEQPSSVDLVLSSAMDLQIKLINDGYAQPHQSMETDALPRWANWRNEIFGFTYEPAVIAINRDFLEGESLPRSRSELLSLIRRKGDLVKGRIGTFDIERVGVGYLTWAHDRQQSGSYGRMLESFGTHHARRFPSSSSMLEALASGEIVIAYNLLGSYALAWAKQYPVISVIMPEDYTVLVMRSAFIPKRAENLQNARLFLNYLLSREGQQLLANRSSLFPIRDDVTGEQTAHNLRRSSQSRFQPIPLGLSLLVHTDKAKRRLILDEWDASMKTIE
ncbi:ABC transporter substrate-binding protein [Neptunomonas sp.]|uniref:ABC transporter substrate-binding protein n=1 Tax=Neptunomonas sp. TaxID=1971898 RepID=UPI0035612D40